MRVLPLLLALFSSTAVRAWAQEDSQTQEETRCVEAVAQELIAADNARDVERVVSLYAPDAVLLPPNESPVEGIAAIRPRYEEFFRTHELELGFLIEEVIVADGLAYVRGRTLGTIRGSGGIADEPINDVFLMILTSSDRCAWTISRLMWHAAADGGSQ